MVLTYDRMPKQYKEEAVTIVLPEGMFAPGMVVHIYNGNGSFNCQAKVVRAEHTYLTVRTINLFDRMWNRFKIFVLNVHRALFQRR